MLSDWPMISAWFSWLVISLVVRLRWLNIVSAMQLLLNTVNNTRYGYKPVADGGKFLVTHLAKGWHENHSALVEQLKPLGITPAYDGMIVEI